jgi:Dolichyl-phosphate-mannose-protein mannosyltransferase
MTAARAARLAMPRARVLRARLLGRIGLVEGGKGVAVLVAASVVLRGVAAAHVPTPWINADETIYAELGRSLWHSGHFRLLGAPTAFYSLVYPALVGGPLSLADRELGYELLKWLQALVVSLTAVPVYLWGRSLVGRRWAVLAAALALAIPGLAYSSLVLSEVAFYPLTVLGAWAMASALESPTTRNQALVLATTVLAVATRLQALVLVPAFVTAIVLKLVFDRSRLRSALAYAPSLAAVALASAGWIAWRALGGGGAAVLGAYRSAGEASYDPAEAARYVSYHAGDLVLLTGVVPAVALLLLAIGALRGRETSNRVRALLAVTLALAAWYVAEVGVFASRLVGTLAERNLFALAPLVFLAFVVWLARGAPREDVPLAVAVVAAFAVVATIPARLVSSRQTLWYAFTLTPIRALKHTLPGANLHLLLICAALPLLALAALTPVARLWALPAVVLALFVALSVYASHTVASETAFVRTDLLGGKNTRWIDGAAPGRVVFLFGGETNWTAVYENVFWNRKIGTIYTLPGFPLPGPFPQRPVGPEADGRVVFALARRALGRYVVSDRTITLFGSELASRDAAKLILWHARPPFRMSTWLTGIGLAGTHGDARGNLAAAGTMESSARLVVYACRGGVLRLTIAAHERPTFVEIARNDRFVRGARIAPWASWTGAVAVRPSTRGPRSRGVAACDFELRSSWRVDVKQLDLTRA